MATDSEHDYVKVVQDSLSGGRAIDEKTFFSVGVLAERLEKVRAHGGVFDGITFSPHVDSLACCDTPLAIS
ncbi:MAG: hypothetical protein KAR47_15025 [Planctomycetes bacterium]|nr:hypothetical protein [Planctomycetota bacterium]